MAKIKKNCLIRLHKRFVLISINTTHFLFIKNKYVAVTRIKKNNLIYVY